MYVAMLNKADVRDIYAKKAECRRDETTVNNYISAPVVRKIHDFKQNMRRKKTRRQYVKDAYTIWRR